MFGHLPEQTVDINRGVWKVSRWRDAREERAVDTEALKAEVLRQARPWSDVQRDSGLLARLQGGQRALKVASLARDRGVDVEPFPRIWLCANCNRVHRTPGGPCGCGVPASRDQVHFVCYCRNCGALDEPPVVPCPTHRETRIRFPGTMAADRIIQDCPVCGRVLRRGFAGKTCSNCGQQMEAQVHRSSAVFTPRTAVIVNPPDRALLERIEAAGGGAAALQWLLGGMGSRWIDSGQRSAEALRELLRKQGLSNDLVEDLVRQAIERGEVAPETRGQVPAGLVEPASQQAKHIAVALASSRRTFEDLRRTAPDGLRETYEVEYGSAIARTGLAAVEYVDRFPVLTGSFGYTRGPSGDPTQSVLVPFVDQNNDFLVYGEVNETEALFFRLDPVQVVRWMAQLGLAVQPVAGDQAARIEILRAIDSDATGLTLDAVTKLVHSFSHRMIRLAAVHTGVERTSLSEFLTPLHLGFFVYAASKGDFVMGGLQAVFEGELHNLLADFVDAEHRCALDPGCEESGGACMACLHLGEPSCRLFNQKLDRATLHGPTGYVGT